MVPFVLPILESLPEQAPSREVERPAEVAPASEVERPRLHDALFPGGGHLGMTVASGLPFVAIGELALGIGDRVAIGAIGGATPDVPGFGLRPRVSVFDTGTVRGVLVAPSLYYPTTAGGGSPWLLTRPAFVVEHRWASGVRLGGGVGMVAASSIAELAGEPRRSTYAAKEIQAGLWQTLNVTLSVPVASKTSLFAESALIFHGARLAGDEWVGVLPFMVAGGITTDVL